MAQTKRQKAKTLRTDEFKLASELFINRYYKQGEPTRYINMFLRLITLHPEQTEPKYGGVFRSSRLPYILPLRTALPHRRKISLHKH